MSFTSHHRTVLFPKLCFLWNCTYLLSLVPRLVHTVWILASRSVVILSDWAVPPKPCVSTTLRCSGLHISNFIAKMDKTYTAQCAEWKWKWSTKTAMTKLIEFQVIWWSALHTHGLLIFALCVCIHVLIYTIYSSTYHLAGINWGQWLPCCP
jgi:hypothetical protein